jgi:membrane fusion protein, multidrug efflux system
MSEQSNVPLAGAPKAVGVAPEALGPVTNPVEKPLVTSAPVATLAATTPASPPQPAAPVNTAPAKPRPSVARFILPLLVIGALSYGANLGWTWWTSSRFVVSTDDAYVKADMSILATKIAGYVDAVPAGDNAVVKAGDVLVQLDDGDYRLAVEAAERKQETQETTIARLAQQVDVQNAQIAEAEARLVAAQADVTRSAADFSRASNLAKSEFGSRKSLDDARADRDRTKATVASSLAAIATAKANLGVTEAQIAEAKSVQRELATMTAKAKRDLEFAVVKAPFNGVVGNRAVQPGQYVQPGTRLMALIPLTGAYVEANFKETQLHGILAGQAAEVTIDALSGEILHGIVDSIAPAAGSEFSLLPPENATGNFTKIVQRVPVKIWLPGSAAKSASLRPGLSVVVDIDTRGKPGEPPRQPEPTLLEMISRLLPGGSSTKAQAAAGTP